MTTQKENLGPLKFMVGAMGLLLVGGFIFLMALVMGKAGGALQKGSGCVQKELVDLTSYGHPVTTVWKGDQLRIMAMDPGKEGSYRLLTVDTCSGKLRADVEVKTLAPLKQKNAE